MLTLHHAPASVCSQKVRIGLALTGLEWTSVLLDLQRGDQFAEAYLKLNPDAVVPTLVDGDLVVLESSLILVHLDRAHGGGALMPADPAGRAKAEHWLLRCLAIHAAVNTLSFATAMRTSLLAARTPRELLSALRWIMTQRMIRKPLCAKGIANPRKG